SAINTPSLHVALPMCVAGSIEVVVVVAQRGHVHHAFYVNIGEFDEEAEVGHADDQALELLTHTRLHVFTLQPVEYVPGGGVGARSEEHTSELQSRETL